MQERSAGISIKVILVCLIVLSLAAGCASGPKQTVFAPVFNPEDCKAAVKAGALAMADCSRERVLAQMESRQADYTKPRESLASALVMLQPKKQSASMPEFEQAALCFETALAGIDRVVLAQKQGDTTSEAVGWEMFDQSAGRLLLALEPYAKNDEKARTRAR